MKEVRTLQTIIASAITGSAAVIAAILALVGVVITVHKSNDKLLTELDKRSELDDKKLEAKLEKYSAVTDEKIAELTREVRKHNGFAEKMPVVEEQIRTIYKKLDKLESDGR